MIAFATATKLINKKAFEIIYFATSFATLKNKNRIKD